MHEVPSYYSFRVNNTTLEFPNWINNIWEKSNITSLQQTHHELIARTDALSARLVFETKAKCQDFVARYKDDGTLL